MPKNLVFVAFLALLFSWSVSGCALCLHTHEAKTGTIVSHPLRHNGCLCNCTQKRYSDGTCAECGHKVKPSDYRHRRVPSTSQRVAALTKGVHNE